MEGQKQIVAALDVGTTSVRCHILDASTATLGEASAQVTLLYPEVGRVEIEPEPLWDTIVKVLRDAIKASGVTANQITCLGISTQRCSFTVWDRETGKPFYNFITWKDVRADSLVKEWNDSFTMKGIRAGGRCLYTFTRNKRYLAASMIRLMNTQVTMRLVWALENVPGIRAAAQRGQAMFGTVDTWLLYRLTGGKKHMTDYSNASGTGMFDPFTMAWGDWALNVFDIPPGMLPEVCDTAGDFGHVSAEVLGAEVPIRCSIADQAASLFGSCCFNAGDIKVTLGTGTFMNVNTGRKPHASIQGLYPQVGWKVGDELVYSLEGANNDTGSLIKWAIQVGLLSDPAESSAVAEAASETNGLFFIPAFSGLQAPINDFQAASGFLGIKPDTSRGQMVRAILESIVFRVVQLYHAFLDESKFDYQTIRVDGGVSLNNFVAQLVSDMTGLEVERPTNAEMSVLGAGFLAGIQAGVWSSKEELCKLRQVDRVFRPRQSVHEDYKKILLTWSKAVERFLQWYDVNSKM